MCLFNRGKRGPLPLWRGGAFFLGSVMVFSGCLGPIARGPRSKTSPASRLPAGTSTDIKKSIPQGSFDGGGKTQKFSPPLSTFRIRSPYGPRGRKFHGGVDLIESPRGGDPIFASWKGVVKIVSYRGGYGRMVLLRHGEMGFTRYAHLQKVVVRKGQTVQQGERIGFVGKSGRASGPHLHFEILTPEFKTVDPTPFLFPVPHDTPVPSPRISSSHFPVSSLPPAIPSPQKLK